MKHLHTVDYGVMNPDFEDHQMSRIEVWENGKMYATDEGIISGPDRIVRQLKEILDGIELKDDEYLIIDLDTKEGNETAREASSSAKISEDVEANH